MRKLPFDFGGIDFNLFHSTSSSYPVATTGNCWYPTFIWDTNPRRRLSNWKTSLAKNTTKPWFFGYKCVLQSTQITKHGSLLSFKKYPLWQAKAGCITYKHGKPVLDPPSSMDLLFGLKNPTCLSQKLVGTTIKTPQNHRNMQKRVLTICSTSRWLLQQTKRPRLTHPEWKFSTFFGPNLTCA